MLLLKYAYSKQIHTGGSQERARETSACSAAARHFVEMSSIIIWAPASKGRSYLDFFPYSFLIFVKSGQPVTFWQILLWEISMVILVILAFSVLVNLQTVSPSNLCSTAGLCCKHRDRCILTRICPHKLELFLTSVNDIFWYSAVMPVQVHFCHSKEYKHKLAFLLEKCLY